jgi:Ca-activated chloride channel family protein
MFKFAHPGHLWLLLALPAVALSAFSYWSWRSRMIKRLNGAELIIPPFTSRRFIVGVGTLAGVISLLVIAWAEPQWGVHNETVSRKSSDVIIALDISKSMLCQDIAPDRLEIAKLFARKLVSSLEGQRVGLVFFAGTAFLQMPLSNDYGFIQQSIQSATTDLLTNQGTNIAEAIAVAEESLDQDETQGAVMVILTDGEVHDDDSVEGAAAALEKGLTISTVGAGSEAGGPIPVGNGQYKKDENGQPVITGLNEAALREIAAAGGGKSFHVNQGDAAISVISDLVKGTGGKMIKSQRFVSSEARFQFFVLPALLLLLLQLWLFRYKA